MAFEYSRQQDLDDIRGHLKELKKSIGTGVKSLKQLKAGEFDNMEKITALESAIKDHESEKLTEEAKYNAQVRAEKQLAVKKHNYPLAVEYLKHLEAIIEIGQTLKAGHGYQPALDFEIALGTVQSEFKRLRDQAKKGVHHLEQFKDK